MLPVKIGNTDFINIKDAYYVDKTLIVKEIIDSALSSILLITRPRRFGKTLALSMMECFFDETKKDKSSLFDNLHIASYKEIREKHQNKYEIIHLNFKDIRGDNYQIEFNGLRSIIAEQFNKFNY